MAALYPICYRDHWTRDSVVEAVSAIATSIGFAYSGSQPDVHESDAEWTLNDLVRECSVTDEAALAQLQSYLQTISDCDLRLEHRWALDSHEISLFICESNAIPFPAPDIRTSGNLWFACGFVDLAMPDRDIDRMQIHDQMATLPLLFAPK